MKAVPPDRMDRPFLRRANGVWYLYRTPQSRRPIAGSRDITRLWRRYLERYCR